MEKERMSSSDWTEGRPSRLPGIRLRGGTKASNGVNSLKEYRIGERSKKDVGD